MSEHTPNKTWEQKAIEACEGMADPEAEIKALRAEVATPVLVATNRLVDALADSRAENARLREALESIEKNGCCDLCQEAAKVARAVLGKE
jgi:hypothetical protein